jgi:hypothetical protein
VGSRLPSVMPQTHRRLGSWVLPLWCSISVGAICRDGRAELRPSKRHIRSIMPKKVYVGMVLYDNDW